MQYLQWTFSLMDSHSRGILEWVFFKQILSRSVLKTAAVIADSNRKFLIHWSEFLVSRQRNKITHKKQQQHNKYTNSHCFFFFFGGCVFCWSRIWTHEKKNISHTEEEVEGKWHRAGKLSKSKIHSPAYFVFFFFLFFGYIFKWQNGTRTTKAWWYSHRSNAAFRISWVFNNNSRKCFFLCASQESLYAHFPIHTILYSVLPSLFRQLHGCSPKNYSVYKCGCACLCKFLHLYYIFTSSFFFGVEEMM